MKETWNNIGIKDKMQILNGTLLIVAAIALYFVSFILTMTIGMGVISAGGTMLASGLAFFGIMAYVKTEITEFKNTILEDENKFRTNKLLADEENAHG